MFDANIKEKKIDNGFDVFMNITTAILDHSDDTQFYMPGLTFLLVLYTYYVMGEGKVWKHLVFVTLAGLMASSLSGLFNIFRDYFSLDYVLQIKWFEAIFWHLNEYGYVYITFIKLNIVVKELEKKYWKYVMIILFIYNLIVRFIIALAIIQGRKSMAGSHFQLLTFLPLAGIEFIFMCLIVKTFLKNQSENAISTDIITTMLNSTLTRMFLVGLIYFFVSIVSFFYSSLLLKNIKYVVYRAKSSLGLIFLLDLLFIRIDLKKKIDSQPETMNHRSRNFDISFLNSNSMKKSNSSSESNYNNAIEVNAFNNSSSDLISKSSHSNSVKLYNYSEVIQ